jgi:UDP-N-acetylmuramoyl-tripeptide--D-alanyl-D-alanine ligase
MNMKNMTLENLAKAVNGELFNNQNGKTDEKAEASGVVIDSRQVSENYIFIATKGERVDGHDFIDSAFEKGALGVICEKVPANPKGAYILVKDSFQALKDVAEFYRSQLDIKVVGITGSVGKTSTKEFVASVLSKEFNVLKTAGNFNNEVGLPLTVLKIRSDCQVAVLEMGISDFGEMHRLSRIAKPDVCLITNIGQCHLENLGTRDGILKAKSEIFDFMQENGAVCLNGDDDKLSGISEVKGVKPIFFGKSNRNDVYVTDYENLGLEGSRACIQIGDKANFETVIPLPGEHMLYNALAATAVGNYFGLSIEKINEGIRDVEPVGGRSHVINTGKITLIDDCYNANPVSMKSAIDLMSITKSKSKSRKIAILGDMFELGENEAELHYEVGEYAASQNLDTIVCIGKLCANMYQGAQNAANSATKAYYFENKEQFLAKKEELIREGDIVLVKASHGMHFEEIISQLQSTPVKAE